MSNVFESPFCNDMFAIVYMAFKHLYPDKQCLIQWVPEIEKDEKGHEVYGLTTFADDGNVYVDILAKLNVIDAVEILAHELAHVAVGDKAGHGKEWQDAFDDLDKEYNRIGYELFDVHNPVEVVSGKDYVEQEAQDE